MRIGIDARFWGTATGIGRYITELFEAMKAEGGNEFVLFLRKADFEKVSGGPNIFKVAADEKWYTLGEQVFLPAVFDGARCDLIHFPHWNVPLAMRTPFVLTVHDLLLLDFPSRRASLLGPVRYAVKNIGFRIVLNGAVRRAKAIIVPSKFTAGRVSEFFPEAKEKVRVIYEGRSAFPKKLETATVSAVEVKKPYLLYAGNAYPHKNLEFLIESLKKMREEGEGINLVLVGEADDFYKRLKKKYGGLPFVSFFGRASDADLDALYRGADAYVFPSLQEGFGLPGLEAMERGIPVVAARSGSLPEIYGDAAVYFDPNSVSDLVLAVRRVRKDTELRNRLVLNGAEQAKKYSWDEAASETLKIYESVAKNFIK